MYVFFIIVIYVYFIYISQGSVEKHSQRDEIYNNHVIAKCPQSMPVKEIWKSVNTCNWQRYGQK